MRFNKNEHLVSAEFGTTYVDQIRKTELYALPKTEIKPAPKTEIRLPGWVRWFKSKK